MIKIDGIVITPTQFPDGTQLIKHNPKYGSYWADIEWFYEGDQEMFTLYCLTKHIQQYGPCRLFLTYTPNARMDRVKSDEEVFTLKYFADFINGLNYERVTILDPHSYVTPALINRVQVIQPSRYIQEAIFKVNPDVLFFPDEGAMKRYGDLVKVDCGRAFGMKKRDWKTGAIQGLDIYGDDVVGKNILIIDDICSKGGTFFHSARKLKEAGAANISLYITHCEDTIFEGELLKDNGLIDRIYTTNSLFHGEHDKIEVFEV